MDRLQSALDAGDFLTVERIAKARLIEMPQDWYAMYWLGQALHFQGDDSGAAVWLKRSYDACPADHRTSTALALGIALQRSGQLDEAAVVLEDAALKAGDQGDLLWNSLGITQRMRDNAAAALAAYENGIDVVLFSAVESARRARLCGVNRDHGSVRAWRRGGFQLHMMGVLRDSGAYSQILVNLARILVDQGETQRAIRVLVRAALVARTGEPEAALESLGVSPSESLVDEAMDFDLRLFDQVILKLADRPPVWPSTSP